MVGDPIEIMNKLDKTILKIANRVRHNPYLADVMLEAGLLRIRMFPGKKYHLQIAAEIIPYALKNKDIKNELVKTVAKEILETESLSAISKLESGWVALHHADEQEDKRQIMQGMVSALPLMTRGQEDLRRFFLKVILCEMVKAGVLDAGQAEKELTVIDGPARDMPHDNMSYLRRFIKGNRLKWPLFRMS